MATLSKEIIGQMNDELRGITDKVNLHGKKYVMVKDRIAIFRKHLPEWRMDTQIIDYKGDEVIIKAFIFDDQGNTVATGMAHEVKMGSSINKTSFVENCETSALGRALANLGLGIDASYASGDEVLNAMEMEKIQKSKPKKFEIAGLQSLAEEANQDLDVMFSYASEVQGYQVKTWDDITYGSYYELVKGLERKLGKDR